MTETVWIQLFNNLPTAAAVFVSIILFLRHIEKRDDKMCRALDALTAALISQGELLAALIQAQAAGGDRMAAIERLMREHERDVAARPCIMAKRGMAK